MSDVDSLANDLWLIPPGFFTHEQTFTSPGTWTCPSTTTWVEVIAVGGGGGGGLSSPIPSPIPGLVAAGFGGGGGAVLRKWLPVSGPVPVTVGAGGDGAKVTPAASAAQAGGASAFGPLAPPVPPTTFIAGGGGSGSTFVGPTFPAPLAPFAGSTPAPTTNGGGNAYLGAGSNPFGGGGVRSQYAGFGTSAHTSLGRGKYGFGGQNGATPAPGVTSQSPRTPQTISEYFGFGVMGPYSPTGNATANQGGGGGGAWSPISQNGGNGGSGLVIVRWKE